MNRVHRSVAGLLAVASSASAQSFTSGSSISFALRWSEFGGNNNGVLEPGEAALITLDVAFTNQNTVAHFAPNIGTFGSGTIRGLAAGFIDINGAGAAQGQWDLDPSQGYGVNQDWNGPGGGTGNGTPASGGARVTSIIFGQFAPTPSSIITTNPILVMWSGVWTPTSYAPRTVSFAVAPAEASGTVVGAVTFRLSASMVASTSVVDSNLLFGRVVIPVVPAPSSLVVIGLAHRCARRPAL
jgi:hypothetical protein